jgi:putative MATE family efflux protein
MAIIVREKSFYKTLFTLAGPIVMQNMITFGVGFVDNLMVGSLKEYAISGVYMGNQIQTVLQMIILGINVAMQVLAIQYWGKGDAKSIKRIIAIAFRFTMILTTLLWLTAMLFPGKVLSLFTNDPLVIAEGVKFLKYVCFSYIFFGISQLLVAAMRSVESVKIGMYVSILALVSHIILNWLLIFGNLGIPALGVEGIGIATLISRILEAGVMIFYVGFVDKKLHLRVRDMFLRDAALLRDYLKYGLPVIAGQIVWAINNMAYSAILGRLSAEAIAAASITGMLHSMVYIWALGLAAAVSIITGKTVGAGEYEKMKLYAKTIQIIFVIIGVLSGLLIFALRDPLLMLYNINQDTLTIGRQFMTVLAITMVGTCYQGTCLGGLVKAGGDTSFVFINDTIFVFLTVIPSALIAMYVFAAPAWVIFACLKSDQITKCFVAVIKINRFHWMKNLTRQSVPLKKTAYDVEA